MGNFQGGMSTPIFNPPVPYRGSLPMAPGHGSAVIINGIVPSWCNRFEINLETDSGDKALHFNPRFEGMNKVIRNTCRGGAWGSEEKHGHFPFALGQAFELNITIEEHHYRITVNGRHMCDYKHRVPKDMVRQLSASGDLQLSQIRFQAGMFPSYQPGYPAPQPPQYPPMGHQPPPPAAYPSPSPFQSPLYNPPMPVNAAIPGGMHPGKMIRINGQTGYNPSRFNVNLVHGNGFHHNADVALHCDFRFNYGDSRNIVVRTHRQHGSWGSEERHANFFPFVPNQPFELIIRAEHDKYMIAVNGQHMFEFHHRMHPLHIFDHLCINGDVNVSMVQFQ